MCCQLTRDSAIRALWAAFLLAVCTAGAQSTSGAYDGQRAALIEEIERDVRATGVALGINRLDPEIVRVLRKVPRHQFVPGSQIDAAYENRPLPIGHGQTISQPYIVAVMTALLEPKPHHRVLELGTGSGYQAAVVSRLVERVYSIEIIEDLGRAAADRLNRLGYANVDTRLGDGYEGWPEAAPFDGILVTAAGDHIPPPLVRQLRPGGRMVIPIGSSFLTQQLMLVIKREDGGVETRELLPVAFVPLTRSH